MAKPVRLDSLRAQIRQRADREGDDAALGYVTDAELTQYINNSVGEYDDLLLQSDAATRRKVTPNINVVSGTDTYALPTDFRHLHKVEYQLDATHWLDVRAVPFDQLNRWSLNPLPRLPSQVPFRYCLNNDGTGWSLILAPVPSSGAVVRGWYTPVAVTLAADSDTVDGINGLEEFIVVDGAIKCRQKEDLDVQVLLMQKQALIARIEETAKGRDQAEPKRISDVGMTTGWGGDGWDW